MVYSNNNWIHPEVNQYRIKCEAHLSTQSSPLYPCRVLGKCRFVFLSICASIFICWKQSFLCHIFLLSVNDTKILSYNIYPCSNYNLAFWIRILGVYEWPLFCRLFLQLDLYSQLQWGNPNYWQEQRADFIFTFIKLIADIINTISCPELIGLFDMYTINRWYTVDLYLYSKLSISITPEFPRQLQLYSKYKDM